MGPSTIALALLVAVGCGGRPAVGVGRGADAGPDAGGKPDAGATIDGGPEATPEVGAGETWASVPDWLPIRVLTNYEYDRVVQDLLGVEGFATATFQPVVGEGSRLGGFNVIHDTPVNDARYEQYFNAADEVATRAFADPALRARIVTCQPAGPVMACAGAIVSAFGLRAWRRPLSTDEVAELVTLAQDAMAWGAPLEAAIQRVVTALLSSAPFLFRMEIDPDPASRGARTVTGYELAARLSFFLWSSIPDARLFQLAGDGTLLRADVLRAEVDRMLDDPRAQAFVESFGGSWLGQREIDIKQVDWPDWEPLKTAMEREVPLFFGDILRGDRSVTELLTADVNFVDARLAAHYGMSTAGRGAAHARVVDTTDARRGYLGLAAVLALTSPDGRTSATLRGRWILSRLLCEPPDGAPIDTPDYPTPLAQGETLRKRVDAIQANAACADCHHEMDGLGMALESFDQVGAFRSKQSDGTPVDDRGALADGTPITGEPALADALARDPRFLPCVARQAMRFALARELDADDEPSLANVVARWTRGVPTLRALLQEIALDDSFRLRRPEGAP